MNILVNKSSENADFHSEVVVNLSIPKHLKIHHYLNIYIKSHISK